MSSYHSNCSLREIKELLKDRKIKIHFVGAGGVGVYSLLVLSDSLGYRVSGSDSSISSLCNSLIERGFEIYVGHAESNVVGADLLVYTLAASEDNPELLYARHMKIPCISRAEYLGIIMENYSESISVSGSHGKSTVSAMLDCIFSVAGAYPTTIIGASLRDIGSPLRIGGDKLLLVEGCEYKDSFLRLSPTATVFTNLELDHVDYFPNIESIRSSFLKAMNRTKLSVVNFDDENLRSLMPYAECRVVSYGESDGADYVFRCEEYKKGFYKVRIFYGGTESLSLKLNIPGRHSVYNAAAAASLALERGVGSGIIESALSSFSGIERRIERLGEYNQNTVFYDYAHHPTEISTVIDTVRAMTERRVAVIFKPHTYSRTKGLFSGFVSSLGRADRVFLCEISAIREISDSTVSSRDIAARIGEKATKVSDADILDAIRGLSGYAIIIMGAADLDTVKRLITGK